VRFEIVAKQAADIDLGAAERRPVIVGQVEVGDAKVERRSKEIALG